jgi:hypothetical protein
MALAPIIMPILSVFKSGGVKEASAAVQGLGSKFGGMAVAAGRAAGALAGFQAIASSKEFVKTSIDATQKFERNLLALQQTFETATPSLSRFIKEVENYGLSQQQAAQASVFLGSVLKQYGFSTSEASDQTQRLVTLAQDLATTYGYDVQDSLLAITALFRGEYDPIEKFGVAMKQNEINAYLAAKGLGNLTGAELANAQATARLDLLMERAGDSIGAFTRASDTLYGSQQRLNAIMGNLQVSFGSAFQAPLAAVNNALANVAQDGGEQIIDIGEEMGATIDALVPLVESLGGVLVGLLAPLEQIIAFGGAVAGTLVSILEPLLNVVDGGLDQANIILDGIAVSFKEIAEAQEVKPGQKSFIDTLLGPEWNRIGTEIMRIDAELDKAWQKQQNRTILRESKLKEGIQVTEARKDAVLVSRFAAEMEIATNKAEALAFATSKFGDVLYGLGIQSVDAQGDLAGLTKVFAEIDEAAAQSKAAEALDKIGFSAGQIEQMLTRPDWAALFGDISRLAQMAALDIDLMTVRSVTAAAGIANARLALEKAMTGVLGTKTQSSPGAAAKDYVKEFFGSLEDEMAQQIASNKLSGYGASEGLIDSILGSSNWEEVFNKVIENGKAGIKSLQDQFNKTSAGLAEINALQQEAIALADEQAEAAAEAAQALQDQQEAYDDLIKSLEAFRASMKDLVATDVLNTIEIQMGRFESVVVSKLENIKSSLKSALDNKQVFQGAYNQLVAYANQEFSALQAIQRQRDALANKYDFVSNLLKSYRDAFTASLGLTSILSSIEAKTREITITEVTTGTASVGTALKDLQFMLKREYTETITETVNKSEALVNSFRAMAEKAKLFGDNLKKLKEMGLDPQLFSQLVQAGVEAGGETAQALVDGGQETISEISSLFKEIGAVGISVGENVAEDFYLTGETFGSALLDGIRSQQDELEILARTMAESFSNNFDIKVGNATQQVAQVAQFNNKLTALQAQLSDQLSKQGAKQAALDALPENKFSGTKAAYNKSLGIYAETIASLQSQISGVSNSIANTQVGALATGGVALGAALSLIGENGPEAVIPLDRLDSMLSGSGSGGNIYNIYVSSNTRTGGSKAGEAVVQQLKQFETKNGPIGNVLKVN